MQDKKKRNGILLRKLVIVAVAMFGFGWALIPLYKQICEITGVNVLTPKDEMAAMPTNSQIDRNRRITVELDANTTGPWRFKPAVSSIAVHPGEMAHVVYEVVNTQPKKVDGQAIPSYAPQQAGPYFMKVECFCFKQQTFEPNEARHMPVVFYIDPKLPEHITTMTLSYTFFEIAGKDMGTT
jgi:cytochrome c oxidase assembly protein subunit 11